MRRIRTIIIVGLFSIIAVCPSCNKDEELINTTPELPLTRGDFYPAWSPDGQWIAYYHDDPTDTIHQSGLYLIDTSGSNRRQLVPGFATTPTWSPDGRWIAFHSGAIYTVSPQGDSLRQITTYQAFFPSWSPGGERIALDVTNMGNENGIWIISLVDTIKKRIGLGRDASWSPIGNKLVYSGSPGSTETESQIWVVDTSGLNPYQLTSNSIIANRNPSWSTDGNKIAWSGFPGGGRAECWLMNSDGSAQRKLADGMDPSWSPRGLRIVFSRRETSFSNFVLWIVNTDGTNLQQLTH